MDLSALQLQTGVNVDLGTALVATLVIWLSWVIGKKTWAVGSTVANAVISRVSFGMLLASLMFVGGISGTGYSVGELIAQSSPVKEAKFQPNPLSNYELVKMVADDKMTSDQMLEYIENRDHKFYTQDTPVIPVGEVAFVASNYVPSAERTTYAEASLTLQQAWGLLFSSAGFIVCSIIGALRCRDES